MKKIVIIGLLGILLAGFPVCFPMLMPGALYGYIIYVPIYGEIIGYRLKYEGQGILSEAMAMPPSPGREEKYNSTIAIFERAKIAYLAQMKVFPNVDRLEENLIEVQKMRFTVGKYKTL